MQPVSAGSLKERIAFESQDAGDDTYGGTQGDWVEQFTRRARIIALRGSEPIIAQRLTGVQPCVITVRSDSETRTVDASFRIRDARSGTLYNIRAVTPDDKRTWIDLLVETGVAT